MKWKILNVTRKSTWFLFLRLLQDIYCVCHCSVKSKSSLSLIHRMCWCFVVCFMCLWEDGENKKTVGCSRKEVWERNVWHLTPRDVLAVSVCMHVCQVWVTVPCSVAFVKNRSYLFLKIIKLIHCSLIPHEIKCPIFIMSVQIKELSLYSKFPPGQ